MTMPDDLVAFLKEMFGPEDRKSNPPIDAEDEQPVYQPWTPSYPNEEPPF
jgi:hypothetical protein